MQRMSNAIGRGVGSLQEQWFTPHKYLFQVRFTLILLIYIGRRFYPVGNPATVSAEESGSIPART